MVLTSYRLNRNAVFSFDKNYVDSSVVGVTLKEVQVSKSNWTKALGEIAFISNWNGIYQLSLPLVLFIEKSEYRPSVGDKLLLQSKVEGIKNKNNPGEFDAENYWKRKGFQKISFVKSHELKLVEKGKMDWFTKLTLGLRNYFSSILSEHLSGNELAVALALILGDKGLISQEVSMQFTNTGAMHVLAVSGLHIGIIMQILMKILEYFSSYISKKQALIAVLSIMWIYAVITGLSPSVLRAVFMFTVLAFSQLSGRKYDEFNSLFFTAFVLIAIDPLTIFDIGFQLSFLAMLGIFLYYSLIRTGIYFKNKLFQLAWDGTAIGFAAQVMTTPLSLYYFHQFPNYFVLSNLGLMATSGAVLGLGLALFAFCWVPFLNLGIALLLYLSLFFSLRFLEWVAALPGAVAYGFKLSFWTVVGLFAIALLYIFLRNSKLWSTTLWLLFTLFVVNIAFVRYSAINQNEVYVFNDASPVVTIKIGQNIFCFFIGDKKTQEKAKLLVTSYQKSNPGNIHYYSIDEKNYHIDAERHKIATKMNADGCTLTVDEYILEIGIKKKKWIDVIYFSNSKKRTVKRILSAKNGAIRIPLY
jgi:competence protein ComEC